MRWTLCLLPALILSLLSSPVYGEPEPEKPEVYAGRIVMLIHDDRHTEALDLAKDFVSKHPDSPLAVSVFRNVIKCRWNEPELLPKVDEVLRAAMNGHPFERCAFEAKKAVEATRHWSFSERERKGWEHLYRTGEEVFFGFNRRGGPDSIFRFLRVPPGIHQQVLEELPTDEWRRLDTALYAHRKSWELVVGRQYPFPHGTYRHWFDLAFEAPGRYYLEEEIEGFRTLEAFDIVTYALCVWCVGDSALVATLDPWTGAPVPGVDITVRMEDRAEKGVTDASGLFRLENVGEGIVISRKGPEVHSGRLNVWTRAQGVQYHVSLDRPLYRPGDEVHYRVVRRNREGGRLALPPDHEMKVHIRGPGEVTLIDRVERWSRSGTISGTAVLPPDASPGGWYLSVFAADEEIRENDWGGSQDFRVADYEQPEVRIAIEADPTARVLGSPVRVLVRAEHWWGAPAEGIEVEWDVSAYRAGVEGGEPFLTGRWQGRPWPDPREWFYRGDLDQEFQNDIWDFELTGRGETGPDGLLAIEFDTEPGAESVNFQFSMRAMGASGREIRMWEDVFARPAEVQVRAGTTRMFYEPGATAEGGVAVVDLDGKPVAGREVLIETLRGVTYGKTIEFNRYNLLSVRTGPDGRAPLSIEAPSSGRMRVRATVFDDEGRRAIHRSDRWVASPETIRHAEDDDAMMLPDRAVYAAGETARILVDNEYINRPLLLLVGGEVIHEAKFIRLKGRFQVIDVPIYPGYAPNVYVKLLAVGGGKHAKETATVAGCELLVLPPGGWVDVGIETDRSVYGPRDSATIRISTTADGKPIPAEVELAVVDESVFTLEEDETEDIRHFFWQSWEDEDWWWGPGPLQHANLDGWWPWIHTARNQGRGFGFGEGAPPAESGFAPAEVRSRGPDTILWRGTLETGEDGTAEVAFVTSGRLTTWRVMARAVAGVEQFGQATSKLVTEQDVVVRLAAPPSMTERDEGIVRVSMRNDLEEDEEFVIGLEVEGPAEGGGAERVTVEAGTERTVEFPLRATGPGSIRLVAAALSVTASDRYETSIPVRAHGTVTLDSETARVEPAWETTLSLPEGAVPGSIRLVVAAETIPRIIRRALPTVVDWQVIRPAGDVARRLAAVVLARQTLKRAGMALGVPADRLDRIIVEDLYHLGTLQHSDGGFGRRRDPASDPVTTDLVLRALSLAREDGHPVPRRVLADTLRWYEAAGGGIEPEPRQDPDHFMARRQGAAWPSPLETARAVTALALHVEQNAGEAIATVNGKPVELTDGSAEVVGLSPGPIKVRLESKAGSRVYGSATLTYEDPDAEGIPAKSEGIHVDRRIERRVTLDNGKEDWRLFPEGTAAKVGDRLRIALRMRGEARAEKVTVECPLPGGVVTRGRGHVYSNAGRWFDRAEFHPDKVVLHLHHLPPAPCRYFFEIRPVLPGTWHVMPAEVSAVESPEVRGRSAEVVLRVE